jgi:hypothetical protein
VRQFNATIREVFAMSPTELRARVRREPDISVDDGGIALRLPYRSPLDGPALLAYLAVRAIPGIERVDGNVYTRSLRLPHGSGTVALRPADGHVGARLAVDDLRDLATAVHRCRTLLDLDCDPAAVTDALGADPVLGPLPRSARTAGRRRGRQRRGGRPRGARPAGLIGRGGDGRRTSGRRPRQAPQPAGRGDDPRVPEPGGTGGTRSRRAADAELASAGAHRDAGAARSGRVPGD